MTKDQAFDLVAQAIQQGGFLRYRKDFSDLKWTFCHPRHRVIKFQGRTALEAVRSFVKMEKRWKESRRR
jgi:hypothetical protein